ncbi:MAG: class I SAM-dependent methyltransferase [Acidobacteriota bacterium]
MSEVFSNVYDDAERASAYAKLELPGTYYLAYRDLPAILGEQVRGTRALDFGCGTGRSSRFLRDLGFDTVGVDIAEPMLTLARQQDPDGDYRLVSDGDLGALEIDHYDLVLAAFTFDNIPTMDKKDVLFRSLKALLREGGRIVIVVSAPELYVNEWASFSTADFPENRSAQSGDTVRVVMLDVEDQRPVEDVLCTDAVYRDVFERAGLEAISTHRPLALDSEPFSWVSETTIAPWAIHVLGVADTKEA